MNNALVSAPRPSIGPRSASGSRAMPRYISDLVLMNAGARTTTSINPFPSPHVST